MSLDPPRGFIWCTPEQLAVIERRTAMMRAALREAQNGMNMDGEVRHKDLQEALDVAIAAAKEGKEVTIRVYGKPESATIRPLAPERKPERLPLPAGVHIAKTLRIGDEVRDKYLEHLREMSATGHITMEETDARMKSALTADTEAQLLQLVSDLPKMTKKEIATEKEELTPARKLGMSVAAAGVFLGAILVVLVGKAGAIPFTICAFVLAYMILNWIAVPLIRKKNNSGDT